MNKDTSGGDKVGEQSSGDNSSDETLKNMAEMMTPEERTTMLSILQGMQKQDRMSGTLSLDEPSSGNGNDNNPSEE